MEQRRRRRAVGPPGSRPAQDEPRPETTAGGAEPGDLTENGSGDDERLLRERPPHHEDRAT